MADVNSSRRVIWLRVEVTLDILCPWSYMQKKALDNAMARFQSKKPEVAFDVVWNPFYINAELEEGRHDLDTDKSSLYTGNMESRDNWDRLTLAGLKYNIFFNHDGRTGPSRDAHKLIQMALWERGSAGQSQVVDALFRGHFEDGRDISDRVWLVQAGEAAGIRAELGAAAVLSSKLGCMVDDAVAAVMSDGGVRASPSTMVGSDVVCGKSYRIGGFQEGPVLEDAFQRMYEAEAETAVTLPHYDQLVASINAS